MFLRGLAETSLVSVDGSMLAYRANHARTVSSPQQHKASTIGPSSQSNTRLLSSADESGPAPKKARSARSDSTGWKMDPTPTAEKFPRQGTATGIVKARDVFLSMNNLSSSGGHDQSSLRRSTRLLNSTGRGKVHSVKVSHFPWTYVR